MRGELLVRCPQHPELGFHVGACPVCERDAEIERLRQRIQVLEHAYTETCRDGRFLREGDRQEKAGLTPQPNPCYGSGRKEFMP